MQRLYNTLKEGLEIMTDNYKIDKLIIFISIAYLWCIITAKYFKEKDYKLRNDNKYHRKSLFKIGLETLAISIK